MPELTYNLSSKVIRWIISNSNSHLSFSRNFDETLGRENPIFHSSKYRGDHAVGSRSMQRQLETIWRTIFRIGEMVIFGAHVELLFVTSWTCSWNSKTFMPKSCIYALYPHSVVWVVHGNVFVPFYFPLLAVDTEIFYFNFKTKTAF